MTSRFESTPNLHVSRKSFTSNLLTYQHDTGKEYFEIFFFLVALRILHIAFTFKLQLFHNPL